MELEKWSFILSDVDPPAPDRFSSGPSHEKIEIEVTRKKN
jgi:hypothetical protein